MPPVISEAAPASARPVTRPTWSWDYARRVALLVLGLAVFALGISCNFKAGIGLGPWDCFHYAVSLHLPITQGQASEATGLVIVLLSLGMGVRPGVGTIANMILIGLFFDGFNSLLPDLHSVDVPWRIALFVLGVCIIGLGSGLYIKANLGAGPRDSLMLALTRRTGRRVAVVRGAVELSALGFGVLLGGPIGLGTLIQAFGVGPAVEAGLRLFHVPVRH
jgi:uncharacterized membrane protein YczE